MNTGLPPENWDTKLQQLNGNILQSRAWAQFQIKLGREVVWAQSENDDWAWLAAVRQSRGLKYLLSSYGPVANNDAGMTAALASLRATGEQLHVDFVRFEPQYFARVQDLLKNPVRRIAEVDPEHTRVIDLTQTEEILRADLASGHRNLINGTERRGISIRKSDNDADFDAFMNMLTDTAARSKVVFYPRSYYESLRAALSPLGVWQLYVAEAEGEPVAAALFYDWGGIRYYAHAGAFQEKNRKVKASVSLVWQALLDAKTSGLKQFDLWGVAPEGDEQHRLASLSRFKAAFGGAQVDYIGTWDMPIKPLKYRLYTFYRRLRGQS